MTSPVLCSRVAACVNSFHIRTVYTWNINSIKRACSLAIKWLGWSLTDHVWCARSHRRLYMWKYLRYELKTWQQLSVWQPLDVSRQWVTERQQKTRQVQWLCFLVCFLSQRSVQIYIANSPKHCKSTQFSAKLSHWLLKKSLSKQNCSQII